jgi:hypothetical protein
MSRSSIFFLILDLTELYVTYKEYLASNGRVIVNGEVGSNMQVVVA